MMTMTNGCTTARHHHAPGSSTCDCVALSLETRAAAARKAEAPRVDRFFQELREAATLKRAAETEDEAAHRRGHLHADLAAVVERFVNEHGASDVALILGAIKDDLEAAQ